MAAMSVDMKKAGATAPASTDYLLPFPGRPVSNCLGRFRGLLDRHAGRRRGLGGLRASDGTGLRREAALERAVDLLLDRIALLARHLGDLRDDEELRAVQHALLAERQVLRARQERQALEHFDDVVDRTGAHPVRIVLEPPLPVLMVVDLAVAEQPEQPLDLVVADGPSEPDTINIVEGNKNGGLVGHHPEVVEPAGRAEDCFGFDALYYAESVIWVNDLVTNRECHTSPTAKGGSGRNARMKQPIQYTRGSAPSDRENAQKSHVLARFCRP